MTEEPKKYRRKVSDERIEKGAETAYNTGEPWVEKCDKYGDIIIPIPPYSYISEIGKFVCRTIAKAVLEADAEVIEGVVTVYPLCGDGSLGIAIGERRMGCREQFHAEYEELP